VAFHLGKSASLAAGIALAALGPAMARDASVHVLNVVLPDGQVEQVSYRGASPPHFVVVPVEDAVPVGIADSPFAEFERMSAMMDRQMGAMMQQAAALSRVTPALLAQMPSGASGTTYVVPFSSDGARMRSTQITCAPGMARPQEVSNVSGECAAGPVRHAAPLTTLARANETAHAELQDAVWRR
jgi:hypothetical protein